MADALFSHREQYDPKPGYCGMCGDPLGTNWKTCVVCMKSEIGQDALEAEQREWAAKDLIPVQMPVLTQAQKDRLNAILDSLSLE